MRSLNAIAVPPATRHTVLTVLFGVALTHVLLWLLGVWAVEIGNDTSAGTFWNSLWLWNRWDTPHYLDLAREGYSNHGEQGLFIVFFPAYPALIRCLAWIVGNEYLSSLIISTVSLVASGIALHRLVNHYRDQATADRAVWYLLIFPTSYFLHIGYTESLFMACLLWLWIALLQRQWFWVGVLGLMLCATRINGALIGLVVAAVALQDLHASKRFNPQWLWVALIPCGLLMYLAINLWMYDNPWHFLHVQRTHWHKSPGTPLTALADLWSRLGTTPRNVWIMGVLEISAVVLALVASIYATLRVSAIAGLWCASNLVLMTSTGWALSLPRYVLVLFPIYIMMADAARRTWVRHTLDLLCVSGLVMLSMEFARGRWAY